jgi:hypothetical protein
MGLTSNAQNSMKLRVDYNLVSILNEKTSEYSIPVKHSTSFIFDYNSNQDILMISADGEKTFFTTQRITNNLRLNEEATYTEIECINPNGKQVSFVIFDNTEFGMVMSDNKKAVHFLK